jgi:hypothetical protein
MWKILSVLICWYRVGPNYSRQHQSFFAVIWGGDKTITCSKAIEILGEGNAASAEPSAHDW